MKLLIAGGGTGGHVSPGLAVAGEWKARHGEGSVVWAGRSGGIEERMALAAEIPFRAVEAKPLKRGLDFSNLALPWFLAKGLRQAWRLLTAEAPAVLLVTGGYVSVPLALAAVLMNKPLVLLEPNAVLGLANRVFAGAAEAVCTAYPLHPPRRNAVLTGNPVRFPASLPGKAAGLKKFGLKEGLPVLLVLPGSGAAHSINEALMGGLKALKGCQLLWMTGPRDADEVKAAVKAAKAEAVVLPFIDEVPFAYAAADLVLARCGASLLSEIALAGKPSLLVPYPHAAGDHQRLNALSFAEAGAARMLADADLDEKRLAEGLSALLNDSAQLKRMAAAARKLGKSDAAANVAGVLDRVAKGFKYV
jgi:UDP-N-acetylglucosamine--N-acetylmuramyl-(pentapeptide) pyrophosphoryl-undecaprenol N-acetylglucosamine transferase